MPLPPEQVAALVAMVGRRHARLGNDLAALAPGVDQHNLNGDLLLQPATTAEVACILAYCNAARIPVVPQGGRTGVSGGAVSHPGDVLLSLERMNRVESLDPIGRTAVVEAGVTLAALAQLAAMHGLSAGIDFGSRDSATIGGMVSTNAGGVGAFRYGTMRDRVLGLEAVLADGSVLCELGRVRKRNEGLAVEQLFVGAEGTLGVVTRVSLALVPEDGPSATALTAVPDATAAVRLCDFIQRFAGLSPLAIELMSAKYVATTTRALRLTEFDSLLAAPYFVLVEVSSAADVGAEASLVAMLGEAVEAKLVHDAVIAQSEAQRLSMWRVREDWAVDRENPGGLWYDVSVPLPELPGYLDTVTSRIHAHDPTLAVYILGHLADGNIHVTVNAALPITERYDEIARLVTDGLVGLGGSFSAEHGIGLEKRQTLRRLQSPVKQGLMKQLKAVLDPQGVMNPGKVIPE